MKIILLLVAIMVAAAIAGCTSSTPGPVTRSTEDSFRNAGALYSRSVDLANEGRYPEALDAADKALALNESSLSGLIQSNRAGILVMLHRYDEAIAAADAAIAVEGNLTTVHAIAWYNKGNALYALGRIPDAQSAYDHAYTLDKTLVPPDMSSDVAAPSARKETAP
jgi:tetratricopeptide (TPR) repeat protein